MGMILYMRRRGHIVTQFQHIHRAAHILYRPLALQFLYHRGDVHRMLLHVQRLDGLIDLLVTRLIECLWTDDLRHDGERVLVYHQRAEYQALQIECLWLQVAV